MKKLLLLTVYAMMLLSVFSLAACSDLFIKPDASPSAPAGRAFERN